MAEVTVNWPVIDRLAIRMAEGGVRAVLSRGESLLKSNILIRPGTGKMYRRGGVEHRASAPGSPPATDIGNLVANTNADTNLRYGADQIAGVIVSDSAASAPLSFGTEKMAARPFFPLLISDHYSDLNRAFYDGARKAMR